ncbi:PEPxxWA-CTERM sorting domain-containing protein [Sphingomonas floccifaciens]|uniref:PEPxxWA-CTERM sorting domain-containing protein n=1 Tax=Sphingomonas floccifaciens TaxID=1844115 RepID=A0ABW4NFS2_9SPHN
MKMLAGGLIAVAAAASVSAPANAGTFVLTSNSNSALSGAVGNSLGPVTVGGITVTATAWSTDSLSSAPKEAYLGRYVNGLGVTNVSEGNGQTNNSHTVDNIGSYDFIKLTFSTAVQLTGMTLSGYDVDGSRYTPIDTDAWVSYGSSGFATNDDWQGYLNRGIDVASGTNLSSNKVGTVWLVGAARSPSDRDDGFKLASITAFAPPSGVPEPATWLTMILGFGVIGGVMRRRMSAAGAADMARSV